MIGARGCDGKSAPLVGFSFDPSLKRCPWAAYPVEAFQAVSLYQRATGKLRVLPFGGRYEDQPQWVGEAFGIIEQTKAEAQARDAEKQRAEAKRIDDQARARKR